MGSFDEYILWLTTCRKQNNSMTWFVCISQSIKQVESIHALESLFGPLPQLNSQRAAPVTQDDVDAIN
jgi:hypothetical protein